MTRRLPDVPLPDQSGRTWLITGATSGIGYETAKAASRAGARLVLASRDEGRAQAAAATLPGPAEGIVLDLESQRSVREAAAQVRGPVDVLVNNAGRVSPTRAVTVDGYETILAANVLGPFAFTNLVLPQVTERVVIVGSNAHRQADRWLDLGDPHFRRRRWSIAGAYSQSKLLDMLWGLALSRRLAGRLAVQLCHPGFALTSIHRRTGSDLLDATVGRVLGLVAQSAEAGAQPTLVAATRDLPECSYVGPAGDHRGAPVLAGRSVTASNPATAEAAWLYLAGETGTDLPVHLGGVRLAAMKKPSQAGKARPQPRPAAVPPPATMPEKPHRPSAESERAREVLADDTPARREAARTYLDSERRAARTGLDTGAIKASPEQRPDSR